MADDFKYDVFLSHSSKDRAVARAVAVRLRAGGLHVWFDEWEIKPRTTRAVRETKIEKGLEDSAWMHGRGICYAPFAKRKLHSMICLLKVGIRPWLDVWVDMRDWENDEGYGFYRLVRGILRKAPGDSPMKRFGVRDVAEWQGGDR